MFSANSERSGYQNTVGVKQKFYLRSVTGTLYFFGDGGEMFTQKRLIILICLAVILVFTAESYAATEAGRVLTVKEKVYLVRDGQRNTAIPEMALLLRDSVETDVKSRTKLFFVDDSILNLGELSRVVVEEYLYSPEKKRSKSIYKLVNGSLRVVVGRSDLEIHTPTAVAAARGTKFILWVEGSGDAMVTGIIVLDGEVMVRNIITGSGGLTTVGKGQTCRIPKGTPPSGESPYDANTLKQFDDSTIVLGQVSDEGKVRGPADKHPEKHFKVDKKDPHTKKDRNEPKGFLKKKPKKELPPRP